MSAVLQMPLLRLSASYLAAFAALRYLLHELHEFGHMTMAWALCGAWGTRDFNNVHPIADGCTITPAGSTLVALAGPLTNYLTLWLAVLLLVPRPGAPERTPTQAAWGLSLVFASLPFARLFTALMGGGDELGALNAFLDQPLLARALTITAILAVLAWPLWQAYLALAAAGRRWWFFAASLLLPMLVEGALVQGVLNRLLAAGVGDAPAALGAPVAVLWVLLAAGVLFVLLARQIKTLSQPQGI